MSATVLEESMPDLFNTIKEAENEANAKIASAKKEAREIIKASEEACALEIKEHEKRLQEEYHEEMEKRKANIQRMLDNKMSDRQKANAQSLKQAENSVTEAATNIMQKVLKNGNS
jgi:vacuolar-type H+-ATPase subunit H